MTAKEVGARIGRSAATVRRWCAEGRITGATLLLGREWRMPWKSVEQFLAGLTMEEGGDDCDLPRWRKVKRAA